MAMTPGDDPAASKDYVRLDGCYRSPGGVSGLGVCCVAKASDRLEDHWAWALCLLRWESKGNDNCSLQRCTKLCEALEEILSRRRETNTSRAINKYYASKGWLKMLHLVFIFM